MKFRIWALLLLATPVMAQPGPKTGPELEVVKSFGEWRTLGLAVSRQGVYTLAFFAFWAHTAWIGVKPFGGAMAPG